MPTSGVKTHLYNQLFARIVADMAVGALPLLFGLATASQDWAKVSTLNNV
jgi:hypothetical protein